MRWLQSTVLTLAISFVCTGWNAAPHAAELAAYSAVSGVHRCPLRKIQITRVARGGGGHPTFDYWSVNAVRKDSAFSSDPRMVADGLWNIVDRERGRLFAGAAALATLLVFAAYVLGRKHGLSGRKQPIRHADHQCEQDDAMLRRSESALRALQGIGSSHGWGFEEKVQELLAFGRKQFNLPIGILSSVVGDAYEIVEVLSPDGAIAKGGVFPLGHTFCSLTLKSSEPVCFEHAAASEWCSHPAYRQHKLEAYLGIRVEGENMPYGTLSFIGPEPRVLRFTETDKEILKLMANWLSSELARQRTESEMRKLSGALEQTADSVMIFSRDELVEYVNPAFENSSGYRREEFSGTNSKCFSALWEDEQCYRRMWETVLNGKVFRDTVVNRHRDGSMYYEEKTITPIKNDRSAATHFVSTGKDVTERIQAEACARQNQAQLAHAQRATAMGAMATSLAHELNQPLAAIVNYAHGCIHRLRNGSASAEELLPALQHIVTEGARSGEIIRRLRGFLRKGESLRRTVDVNRLVRGAADLIGAEARHKRVELRLELAQNLPPVIVDAVQIEQVVLNLVHNAIEAIDAGGGKRREVSVGTEPDPTRSGVQLVVRDTGPGIQPGAQDRIFDAFFTTKKNGMGMGLSISRAIVEAHGDQLWACSNDGSGATFRFRLPASIKEDNNECPASGFRRR